MDFKNKVIKFIQTVPKGKVISYGQVAAECGKPNGAREVGRILRNLDVDQDHKVPWWRVVNQKGVISIKGNWTADKELQASLLGKEGVAVSRELSINMKKYRYGKP